MNAVIIIPTYNEKGNIERLIEILQTEVFPKIKNYNMSILVADDSSPDGTEEVIRGLMKKWKNIEISSGEKKGLGAAYVRGMKYAIEKMNADVLFEMDADLFHDPHKVPEFLKKIDEGYDFVIGTRYSHGGSIPKDWGVHRKLFSIAGNLLVRAILMRFYIHDWTGGYRAIRKEVFITVEKSLNKYKGYTFQVAFLHKAIQNHYTVVEVPFKAVDRTLGRSKIAAGDFITNLLKYVITQRIIELWHSPFSKYAMTGFIGYLINAISLEFFYRQGLHPSLAGAIGAEMSIIWNFVVNNFWAFNQQKITNPWKVLLKFPQFNLVSLGSLGIISTVLFFGTHAFGEHTRQLFLIIAIGFFVIPYSYTMYNIFIWKRWRISFLSKLQDLVG